jgi:outer membrane protein OmpA-like peptidoglycan-associated protein
MVVRDYLVQNFRIDDTRIKTIGLGKSNAAGAASKVQILVYPAESNPRAERNLTSKSQ